jgi:hypothetical protein
MIKSYSKISSTLAFAVISHFALADDQQKLKCTIYYETLTDHRFVDRHCTKSKCSNKLIELAINKNCAQYLPSDIKLDIQSGSANKMLSRIEEQGKADFCAEETSKCKDLHERFGFCNAPISEKTLNELDGQLLNYLFFY